MDCLCRPSAGRSIAYGDPDLCELAAAYAAGIVRNHPFLDGNKRVALLAACIFLDRNGMEVCAAESDAVDVMRAIATGEMSEVAFADWLRKSTQPKNEVSPGAMRR